MASSNSTPIRPFKVSASGVDFALLAPGVDASAPTAYFLSLSPMAPSGVRGAPARLLLRLRDHSAMDHLQRCGIDVPEFFNLNGWTNKKTLQKVVHRLGLPFFVKKVHGAGGYAVWRRDSFSPRELMKKRARYGPLHLQEFMPGEESHNILYVILPEEVRRLLVTRQRVTDNWIHQGNDWPAQMDDLPYADQVADCCRQLGFVGVLGMDLKGKVLEINPRHNTSSVILAILRKVPGVEKQGTSWGHRTTTRQLSALGLDDLWLRDGAGVLPLSWSDRRPAEDRRGRRSMGMAASEKGVEVIPLRNS